MNSWPQCWHLTRTSAWAPTDDSLPRAAGGAGVPQFGQNRVPGSRKKPHLVHATYAIRNLLLANCDLGSSYKPNALDALLPPKRGRSLSRLIDYVNIVTIFTSGHNEASPSRNSGQRLTKGRSTGIILPNGIDAHFECHPLKMTNHYLGDSGRG